MPIRTVGWGTVLVVVTLALAPASTDDPRISTVNDLVYATVGDLQLKLDLAVPVEGTGPFPAVVVFYGGAWRTGNKWANRPILAEFARRGFVAIAPQYRHCPANLFPAQVHDAKAAVRWLRVHAVDYRVDSDHIGAMGFSAGAHLSLMLGTTGPTDGLEGDAPAGSPPTKVQAVVNFYGPTDLGAADVPPFSRGLVRDFLGSAAAERPELAARASPLTYLDRTDAAILTFHGTADAVVPVTQAVRLSEAMTRVGLPGRTELLSGLGHGWSGPALRRTMEAAYAFFEERLRTR